MEDKKEGDIRFLGVGLYMKGSYLEEVYLIWFWNMGRIFIFGFVICIRVIVCFLILY